MQPLLENKDIQEVVDMNNKALLTISDFWYGMKLLNLLMIKHL